VSQNRPLDVNLTGYVKGQLTGGIESDSKYPSFSPPVPGSNHHSKMATLI
jgi:hypothetical protein